MGRLDDSEYLSDNDEHALVVDKYSRSLLAVARQQLPTRLQKRVDPEDIVQSVYRSFFRRLNAGEFHFEESHDVWKLLAVMTYNKVNNTVKFHGRQRRDVRRESDAPNGKLAQSPAQRIEVSAEDVAVLVECLENLMVKLPAEYKDVVVMRLKGYSIAEIATEVQVSRRTVQRVLAKLPETAKQALGVET